MIGESSMAGLIANCRWSIDDSIDDLPIIYDWQSAIDNQS